MGKEFRLCVVTQESTVFDRDVDYVNIPAAFGSLGVLAGHAPMICAVSKGLVRCTCGGETTAIEVASGIAEVADNAVTVLVADAKLRE